MQPVGAGGQTALKIITLLVRHSVEGRGCEAELIAFAGVRRVTIASISIVGMTSMFCAVMSSSTNNVLHARRNAALMINRCSRLKDIAPSAGRKTPPGAVARGFPRVGKSSSVPDSIRETSKAIARYV